ncbi:MAG: hypothetical protein FWE19_08210 [Oscillospiraceae bacterium]|nr:hypothetical protein [Oscillospiraceae bacterium]
MNSLASLQDMLRSLGLYALGRGGLIDAELAAYGVGFEMIEDEVGELESVAHPELATGWALDLHEAAVGLPNRASVGEWARRELILRRLIGPFPSTLAGTEEALAGCGLLDPRIKETPDGLLVSAGGIVPGMTADQCWELALRVLPAHLPAFAMGPTWDEWDADTKSWDERDAQGRSWTEVALVRGGHHPGRLHAQPL